MVKGVGHLEYVWSYGAREVVSSIPDRGNILVGWVFHPTRWLVRFSLVWKCLSFQILNLFRTLSSWGSGNYMPSAPLLYEVASHVKQLPFRPLLLLLLLLLQANLVNRMSLEQVFLVYLHTGRFTGIISCTRLTQQLSWLELYWLETTTCIAQHLLWRTYAVLSIIGMFLLVRWLS